MTQEPEMGYAELIERLQALPPDKQVEVFDFVDFLASRNSSPDSQAARQAAWCDEEFSQMAMAQALRGIEYDPVTYTAADLRERWQ
jgi:protein-disulfide isomerase